MYKEKRVGASNDDEVGEGESSTDEDEEGMSLRGGTEEGRGRPKLAEQLKGQQTERRQNGWQQ